jgi:hypothetical protein
MPSSSEGRADDRKQELGLALCRRLALLCRSLPPPEAAARPTVGFVTVGFDVVPSSLSLSAVPFLRQQRRQQLAPS